MVGSISATSAIITGAVAGFAAGTLMNGGDLEAGIKGAISGMITAGLSTMTADAMAALRTTAQLGLTAAMAHAQGGDWRKALQFAFSTTMAREAWAYTMKQTDLLYAAACKASNDCKYDRFGATTDGGRVWKSGFSKAELERMPALLKWFLSSGMEMEGTGLHTYDPNGWLCKITVSFCEFTRLLVRQVSKPHDWGNSWAYDKNPESMTFGFRLEGGGFTGFWSKVGYEVAVQTWSLATMLPMLGFTSVALYADPLNPGFRPKGD